MALIFLSHSSKDDVICSDLESWLNANGFSSFFSDHSSITAGERWADALRAAAGVCRAVLCLVTNDWLDSRECTAEFRAAWYMGKRIIPLFLIFSEANLSFEAKTTLRRIRSDTQGLNIAAWLTDSSRLEPKLDEVLTGQLRSSLRSAGAMIGTELDPLVFAVEPALRATPFPGLRSFGDTDADAAVFFGRSKEIAASLEQLRRMRAANSQLPLAILGSSGCGKSSLLKAGIIPRIRHEGHAWIALRSFRPGADPLFSFSEALSKTGSEFGVIKAPGAIRDELMSALPKTDPSGRESEARSLMLGRYADQLRAAACRPNAEILVSVDQAEELLTAEDESTKALIDYLRLAAESGVWRLILTLRSDSFAEVQNSPRFYGWKIQPFDLRPIPAFRYAEVIEAPAKRYGVQIDPALVDTLVSDAPENSGLPILAFTLQRLWERFAASGNLSCEHYRSVGGLHGLIEMAAERALCGIEPDQYNTPVTPSDIDPALDAFGASTFIPALADVNAEGTAIRRVASWSDFDAEHQAVLSRFDRWRLVVRRRALDGLDTVEVAHEAIFREWTRLRKWLEPERARLECLRNLRESTEMWLRKRRNPEFSTHAGVRLSEAIELASDLRFQSQITAEEREYLAACQEAQARETERQVVLTRLRSLAVILVGIALVVSGLMLGYLYKETIKFELAYIEKFQGFVHSATSLHKLPDKTVFKDCRPSSSACPEMVVVPGGSFLMGTAGGGPNGNEGPQHLVRVKQFAASRFEITFDNWATCGEAGGCNIPQIRDAGFGRGRHPVINVSWDEANDYVRWLSKITGKSYRLLTEAEWEYAARAGTRTEYPWGDVPDTKRANFGHTECCTGHTLPVGSFLPNAFGLYDMQGNVWEWVRDCYGPYSPAAPASAVRPASSCDAGVLRGGSFASKPQDVRAAARSKAWLNDRDDVNGFRVARDIGDVEQP
jgi:formylglycine-generating enzyme required for sulfatase activity